MNSAQVRQSFLDFFAAKGHAIVPSAPLLPSSPNLLFTNAGMNPFVPYFLGDRDAPWPRAADTQKCIRAGGKHNDLDDVGLDTYHQTFFEMLGNWSFGDYFKEEAIRWAWELLTGVWGFPKDRLYVTVYKPGPGDPSEFDQDAYDIWERIFRKEGMDPAQRILNGNKKDNFWMMGDTGPCGPCSEIHIDLTPKGDTNGSLVNKDSPFCIEIWNLVFIQFNAEEDGSFKPLRNRHVDTGMGFERVAGIIGTTNGFTDFSQPPSNYNCDLFQPIFAKISSLCHHTYGATLPADPRNPSDEERRDIAFRVLADHIRTLSCSIADGILPGNEGRNYVLRRILRRAVLFGRKLELPAGFFAQLVDPVLQTLGPVFPELKEQQTVIRKVIASEESAFDRTIDRGIQLLERIFEEKPAAISGAQAFELYDTYGFPLDLTEIIAAERGLKVDTEGFNREMEAQRQRARSAQHKTVIRVSDADNAPVSATEFIGYEEKDLSNLEVELVDIVSGEKEDYAILKRSPFYAEMGGQVGDRGTLETDGLKVAVLDTRKNEQGQFLHVVAKDSLQALKGKTLSASVDLPYRRAIQRHHSATHILHWALREVLGNHVRQAGSLVDPSRLRFDFSHFEAIPPKDLQRIEQMVNQRILENAPVQWNEIPFDEKPDDVVAFFGEKYGNRVRVVDIGGYSKELCGGTHVRATGEIGLLKINSESAIAAGVRRIEAFSGEAALTLIEDRFQTIRTLSSRLSARPEELTTRFTEWESRLQSLEAELKSIKAASTSAMAKDSREQSIAWNGLEVLVLEVQDTPAKELKPLTAKIYNQLENGLLLIGSASEGKASLIAMASPKAVEAGYKAGDIIRETCAELDGKGGGKPDFAMGGGSATSKLSKVLENWKSKFKI